MIVTDVLSKEDIKKYNIPTICPVCGEYLTLRENGTKLYCSNPDCSTHFSAKLAKWIDTLNVDGFGPALRDFIVEQNIEDISEIYDPKNIENICNTFGSINAKKAFTDLYKKSKTVTLSKLIAGYNIGNVGLELAQTIISAGFDTFEKLWNLNYSDLLKIQGWKDIRAKKFINGFSKEKFDMKELLDKNYITLIEENKVIASENKLEGKKFCITGKLETFTRTSIEEVIKKYRGVVDSGVKKDTNYLITNTPDSGSSKNTAAQKFGTKIITEEEFKQMLN